MTVRVLHLAGSAVDDFHGDLSRLYAKDCLSATADPDRYDTRIAWVSPDLQWRFPTDFSETAFAAATPMPVADAVRHIATLNVDVVVPQMFCLPGMTTYRALFDLIRVPYIGNTPDVMALGAHKARARAVVAAAGVNVPAGEVLRRGDVPSIAPPAVVKPVDSDNSVGITLVRAATDYGPALEAAFAHADEALVETYVALGREVRCGIVVQDGALVCLPLEEYRMDTVDAPIRDQANKIGRNAAGDLFLAAKDSSRSWIVDPADPVTAKVWEAARRCHVALGCRHYSLFDFRIDPAGEPWFLEAGLYCSFARQSVIPTMARAAGIGVDKLFERMIVEVMGRQI